MTLTNEDASRTVIDLLQVSGGMNNRVGEAYLKDNESPLISNFELLQGGGLELVEGLKDLNEDLNVDLPFPCQGYIEYRERSTGSKRVFAYAYPKLYEVDTVSGGYSEVGNFHLYSQGNPIFDQSGARLVVTDGANNPFYTDDGYTWQYMSTWPPTHTVENNLNIIDPGSATANPTTYGFPDFCVFYKNRLYLHDPQNPNHLFGSRAGDGASANTLNFSIAAASISNAWWRYFDFKGGLTGAIAISNFLVVFGQNQFGVLTGTNPITSSSTPDPLIFNVISSVTGAISQNLISKRGNSDAWFLTTEGLYTLSTSENYQTVKPNLVSYPLQPLLNALGINALKRCKFFNDYKNGVLYLMCPKSSKYTQKGRLLKLNYLINNNRENDNSSQLAWVLQEGFGKQFYIDDMVQLDDGRILVASYDRTYYLKGGTSYYGGLPRKGTYFTNPKHMGYPDHNKKIFRYRIKYEADVDTAVYIYHSWENGEGGMTKIILPATGGAQFGEAGFSSDGSGGSFSSSASLNVNVLKREINGNKRGKIVKFKVYIQSSTAKVKLYNLYVSYELEGMGA